MPGTADAAAACATAASIAAAGRVEATIDEVAENGCRLAGDIACDRHVPVLCPEQPASSSIASAYVCVWIEVEVGAGRAARSGASRPESSAAGPIHAPATSALRVPLYRSVSSLQVDWMRGSAPAMKCCHASSTAPAWLH